MREAANDARGIGLSLLAISVAAAHAGEPEPAWSSAERALALFDRTDDGPGRGAAPMQLGYLAADCRPAARGARSSRSERSRCGERSSPQPAGAAPILLELAELDVALGEPERAPARLRRGAGGGPRTSATARRSRTAGQALGAARTRC